MTSRRKGLEAAAKGFTRAMPPATTVVTKIPAPKMAPTASPAVRGSEKATTALKMSGAPLPKARKVTPATLWDSFRLVEMADRLGQKNFSAVTPRMTKR